MVGLSTRWILLASWGGLTLALFASMWSHYTSSRIFSWRVNLLDHGQLLDKAKDKADWKRTYERIQRRIRLWGVLTASLNIVAGWSLILGITLMAVFAVANEPFVQQGPMILEVDEQLGRVSTSSRPKPPPSKPDERLPPALPIPGEEDLDRTLPDPPK
jgi:hypothetical protein